MWQRDSSNSPIQPARAGSSGAPLLPGRAAAGGCWGSCAVAVGDPRGQPAFGTGGTCVWEEGAKDNQVHLARVMMMGALLEVCRWPKGLGYGGKTC